MAKKPVKRTEGGKSKQSTEERQNLFVEAYLSNGGNAKQACITAGYAASSAERQGVRMTSNDKVKAILAKRRTEVVAAAELSTERTVQEVSRLAFSDPRNIINEDGTIKKLNELDAATAAAVASYEVDKDGVVKYKFWDKNSAIEKAAKIQGLYEKDNTQKKEQVTIITRRIIG